PIENLPALNPVKGGRTVPVKWQISDGNGGYISDLSVVASMQFAPVACGSQDTSQTLDLTDVETTGKTRLRYDSTDEQFVLNWKTSKGMKGKCFFFVLDLTDGTSHFAGFRVK
ncbi:MAG: PxKF domain-containing protein, partial [bacterium]